MSVSVAELPAMSQAQGNEEEIRSYLQKRLNRGLQQIAFFIIPSVVGFVFLGDLIVGAVFQTGEFQAETTRTVWIVLAAYSLGLLTSTLGRLYSSTFFSLKDTRTPLRFAIFRVLSSTLLGLTFGFYGPKVFALDANWGVPGLAISASLAGWIEFYFLRRALNKKIGITGLPLTFSLRVWGVAFVSVVLALGVSKFFVSDSLHVILRAMIVLIIYGVSYFFIGHLMKIEQARDLWQKVSRRLI